MAKDKPETAPDPALIADLQAQLAALKAENETLKAAKAQQEADAKIIAEKVKLGLTVAQAKSVIANQRRFDAARAERIAEEKAKADAIAAKTAAK